MSTQADAAPTEAQANLYRPLRTWIPVLILPLMILARFIPDMMPDGPSMTWMLGSFGPFLLSLLILGWWLLLSRARWTERLIGLVAIIAILAIEQVLAHPSMRGPLFIVMTIPTVVAGFAVGAILFGHKLAMSRTWLALLIATVVGSLSVALKTDGVWGNFAFGISPRWSKSAEDKLLTQKATSQAESAAIAADEDLSSTWPSFRGAKQDGVQRGVQFDADWKAHPPKELWRIAVGPAWSSFVSTGKYLVTQEQRGEHESVVCYDGQTGQQVWECQWPSRFFEALGGLGPRATPTFQDGYVYAFGAEGWLVKINARDGHVEWKIDVKPHADRTSAPMWGFSASPLVYDNLVIVHAGGPADKCVLAFNAHDGGLVWTTAASEQSYGSVQVVQVLDRPLLSLLSDHGAHLWEPKSGKLVLDYAWPHQGYRALQPQVIDGDKLLIASGLGTGTRLVKLLEQEGQLTGEEVWTSRDLKPDFNDVLVHKGFIYGFDNKIFTCIDMQTGKRRWKGGHYEKGQALLLADSDLIVVVSERGQLVLLRAGSEKLEELATIPAMNAKTWNHPIVVGDKLYLRNAEEAVCYQLAESSR